MADKFDFSGWATRNDLKCADGRTIRRDAFKDNDKATVPLVWEHQHNAPNNVLGHAMLENREEGVYAFGKFNDTLSGRNAKELVGNGDIVALSIYANQLKQNGADVMHGCIREVSLVLAGANPGAYIDNVISHSGESMDEEAVIYSGEDIELSHSESEEIEDSLIDEEVEDVVEHADKNKTSESDPYGPDATVADVIASLDPTQKDVFYAMMGTALIQGAANAEATATTTTTETKTEGENKDMKHNVFETDAATGQQKVLSHSEQEEILKEAKRLGSFKEAILAHSVTDVDFLFPDATNMDNQPPFITRDMGWVSVVMNGTHHSPFSRIKSIFADLTEDEARARGYIKGKLKKEEVFTLLKRTTVPTTIYKKQKLDRDDVVDITDFDVVSWMRSEMRMMLDEEIARSILVGDGRLSSSDDKINESNIRPIWTDDDLYTIHQKFEVVNGATDDTKADAFITETVKARKNYKGSGSPVMFMTEEMLTNCRLLKDKNGRFIYNSDTDLASALRVSKIVTVPVMEGLTRVVDTKTYNLLGIVVNLADYNVGADKGGQVNMFDDFDIDYNAQKYLIETRCSGALIRPYSAMVIECNEANS